jgi:hypothetical protein
VGHTVADAYDLSASAEGAEDMRVSLYRSRRGVGATMRAIRHCVTTGLFSRPRLHARRFDWALARSSERLKVRLLIGPDQGQARGRHIRQLERGRTHSDLA